jgi:hypothetical protein
MTTNFLCLRLATLFDIEGNPELIFRNFDIIRKVFTLFY